MPRLLSPDDACVSVDVPAGGLTTRYDGRIVNVADSTHARALKAIGYVQADVSGGPVRADGFRCATCGFSSYFRACSRCDADRA